MSRIKTSQAVRTVMNWMAQSLATGEPIPLDQVQAWKGALATSIEGLEAREAAAALIEQQKERIQDRVPAEYAEQLTGSITRAVKRLADMAQDAATLKELPEIDCHACGIIDGFRLLTIGVIRPQGDAPDSEFGG